MKLRIALCLFSGVLLAAGGDDDESSSVDAAPMFDAPAIDANPNAPDANPNAPDASVDAPTGPVVELPTCDGTVLALTVETAGNSYKYTPAGDETKVEFGGIVKFIMPGAHNAVSGANRTADSKFNVGFGETKCLRFVEAGDYEFYCSAHPFQGSITVLPAP